ncbi:MAG: SMC family ATPase [Pseudanabaena sp. ELA607]
MRLISLQLQNFRQHQKTELIFNSGVTGIIGANGAGKSTILEAIAWSLYGNQGGKESNAIRGNTDSLIWRMAPGKSSAIVKLTFAFGGEEYTISRMQSASKSQAEFSHNGKVIANASRTVNDTLTQILGMTQQEFFNSYFTGQKDLQFLGAIKGATDRERFIAKMLGYEHITTVQGATGKKNTIRDDFQEQKLKVAELKGKQADMDLLQANADQLLNNLNIFRQDLELCQQNLRNSLNEMLDLEPQLDAMTATKNHQVDLENQLKILETNCQHNQANYDRLLAEQKELIELNSELEQLRLELTDYDSLNAEYLLQEQASKHDAKRQILQVQLNDLMLENQNLSLSQDKFSDLEASWQLILNQIKALTDEINQTESQIHGAINERQQQQNYLGANLQTQQHLLANLLQQKATIETAGIHGECPTCQRPLEDEYDSVLSNFDRQKLHINDHIINYQNQLESFVLEDEMISQLRAQLKQTKQDLTTAQQHKADLQTKKSNKALIDQQVQGQQLKITKLQQEINAIPHNYDAARYAHLSEQLNLLRPKHLRFSVLESQGNKLDIISAQIVTISAKLNQELSAIQDIKTRLAAISFHEDSYQTIKQQLITLRESVNQAQKQEGELLKSIEYTADSHRLALQAITNAENDARALKLAQREMTLLNELDLSFSELRQYLTAQIRPQLSQNASVFLNQLTQGRYDTLEIDDKYNIILMDHGQPKPVISGGEEDVVNLALRLAVSQMITERTGKPFSLLILDEVFGSLDDDRKDNVLNLLNALETQFEQIFLITHVDSIKDSLNNIIRLSFDPKGQCTKVIYPD